MVRRWQLREHERATVEGREVAADPQIAVVHDPIRYVQTLDEKLKSVGPVLVLVVDPTPDPARPRHLPFRSERTVAMTDQDRRGGDRRRRGLATMGRGDVGTTGEDENERADYC
jgi:hypothetical protein